MTNPIITRVAEAIRDNLPRSQVELDPTPIALAALEALAEGLVFDDATGHIMLNKGRTMYQYVGLGSLHYGVGSREGFEMGEPYKTQSEAKTALMNHARSVLFGLGPKEESA